ncbi:hypothetical protein VSU19_08360 [Verrucomicrobiales bacterium BCK34]|nr:hypothetical protein [Verrucomicrobiales bacterium BCK34]
MIVALLFLYFGVPVILALIIAAILHAPFSALRDHPAKFRRYVWIRVALALLGPIAMLIFKLIGGYDNVLSSEFSPIGTDERGVVVYVVSHSIIAFTIVSLFELIHTAGNYEPPIPENDRTESGRSRD